MTCLHSKLRGMHARRRASYEAYSGPENTHRGHPSGLVFGTYRFTMFSSHDSQALKQSLPARKNLLALIQPRETSVEAARSRSAQRVHVKLTC